MQPRGTSRSPAPEFTPDAGLNTLPPPQHPGAPRDRRHSHCVLSPRRRLPPSPDRRAPHAARDTRSGLGDPWETKGDAESRGVILQKSKNKDAGMVTSGRAGGSEWQLCAGRGAGHEATCSLSLQLLGTNRTWRKRAEEEGELMGSGPQRPSGALAFAGQARFPAPQSTSKPCCVWVAGGAALGCCRDAEQDPGTVGAFAGCPSQAQLIQGTPRSRQGPAALKRPQCWDSLGLSFTSFPSYSPVLQRDPTC